MAEITKDACGWHVHQESVARPIDRRTDQTRVIVDTLLALTILVGVTPIILLSLILVRITSRGPAIYTQKRLGRNGRCFMIHKIRTMYQNSEPNGPRWCVPGDRRVTPVGRLLRWSHLDELPQLVNVLQGDMSLIGPRPERPEIVAQLERALPDYQRRHVVRPGLTGLAQVLQAPDTDLGMVRRKLSLDLHYVDSGSFWLDLRILLATVLHVLNIPSARIAQLFGFPKGPDETEEHLSAPPKGNVVASQIRLQLPTVPEVIG